MVQRYTWHEYVLVMKVYLARRCTRYEYVQCAWHKDALGMNNYSVLGMKSYLVKNMYSARRCAWYEDVLGMKDALGMNM